jgi:uncharacterized Zn-binding protein involved in type VI secretion
LDKWQKCFTNIRGVHKVMPGITRIGDQSTGHGCFPPTPLIASPVSKTFVNGARVGVVSPQSYHATHSCGITVHPQPAARSYVQGSSNTFIEGFPATRIGDNIQCGDAVAQGSPNTFIGG